jgi:alkanesulfonate monooxygenase SsuD/methylene tetrahydromethanopterin reductase-like flavin-dependent oxidoreductase (luciferase family)
MLRIAAPHVQAWNAWFSTYGNATAGLAEQRELVDAACRDTGADPAAIERTVAVFVRLPGAARERDIDVAPIEGAPEQIAAVLRSFAAEGIGHVQLVIDPVTPAGVDALAPVLEALDAG